MNELCASIQELRVRLINEIKFNYQNEKPIIYTA